LRHKKVVLAITVVAVGRAVAAGAGYEALEYGFRFASAIVSDEKDRSAAQQSVLLDLAELGGIEEAAARVSQVEGWRRGIVYADLGVHLAADGQKARARQMIDKAEEIANATEGWQKARVKAHVAQALGAVGEKQAAEGVAVEIAQADPKQYAARSVATVASGSASEPGFDDAMGKLDSLSADVDLEAAWWRTVGYASLARRGDLPRGQRMKALEAARGSASAIQGWKQAEALESIAEEYRKQGEEKKARECLEAAQKIVRPLPETTPVKAALMSNLARAWTRLGETKLPRELLAEAEPSVARAPLIERPALYASVASGFVALNDTASSKRLYDRALGEAEALVNARPRALAVVAICRSLGRQGQELDAATRGRLDSLLAGLKDPW